MSKNFYAKLSNISLVLCIIAINLLYTPTLGLKVKQEADSTTNTNTSTSNDTNENGSTSNADNLTKFDQNEAKTFKNYLLNQKEKFNARNKALEKFEDKKFEHDIKLSDEYILRKTNDTLLTHEKVIQMYLDEKMRKLSKIRDHEINQIVTFEVQKWKKSKDTYVPTCNQKANEKLNITNSTTTENDSTKPETLEELKDYLNECVNNFYESHKGLDYINDLLVHFEKTFTRNINEFEKNYEDNNAKCLVDFYLFDENKIKNEERLDKDLEASFLTKLYELRKAKRNKLLLEELPFEKVAETKEYNNWADKFALDHQIERAEVDSRMRFIFPRAKAELY